MAMTKLIWVFIISLFKLKGICANISCDIQEGGEETMECGNYNGTHIILHKGFLKPYNNFKVLLLNLCYIEYIDTDVFEDIPSLTSLDLSENRIENITVGTFDALKDLEELNLFNNYIEDLPVDLFKYNVKLRKLDLGDNALTWFNVGVFDNLVNLTSLILSSNYIDGYYLNSELFRRNINIANIKFIGNNMSHTPDNLLSSMDKLISVNLKRCHLTEFPTFLISSNITIILFINLRQNKIRTIENNHLENFHYLSMLDLSQNQIEYIEPNAFKNKKNLAILNLKQNLLTSLPNRLFSTMIKLSVLDLSHNMITVLEDDLFKRIKLKYFNIAYNRLTYLQQDFCQQQNTGAILKIFFFNHNPWQCACLRDLLDEVKVLRIKYNSTYFDGGQPVCVTAKEFVCKRQEHLNSFYADLFDNIGSNTIVVN